VGIREEGGIVNPQPASMNQEESAGMLKSLGFPDIEVHHSFNHFDFTRPSRRILVVGPMGSGKTEYSSRVWRDSQVTLNKSAQVGGHTSTGPADRRRVFFIRSRLDTTRFSEYPDDALAFRGGYERLGSSLATITDSFELESLIEKRPDVGTWIIDEASFYDERLAYIVREYSEKNGLIFIFPTLIMNFRRDIFNPTARLLLEASTDVFPLTAYCEHPDCIANSLYTYRYYQVDGDECPAIYFDPLIIIGGDRRKNDPSEPNYCTRCDRHHYLPGKEYTFLTLKPLGEQASRGEKEPLREELKALNSDITKSRLYRSMYREYIEEERGDRVNMNALKVPLIAEKALMYLYAEQNLINREQLIEMIDELALDRGYIECRLKDNRRPITVESGGGCQCGQ